MCSTFKQKLTWNISTAIVIILYTFFILFHFKPAISSIDSSGYLKQAQLISQTGKTTFEAESDLQYIPPHWLQKEDSTYISHYPPGLAVFLSIFHKIGGPDFALLLNTLLSIFIVTAIYFITSKLTNELWGFLAVLLIIGNPILNNQALNQFAHIATTAFFLWGVYFYLAWNDSKKISQLILSGFLLSSITTIRYPETLLMIPFAVFITIKLIRKKAQIKAFVLFGVGIAIPLLLLAIYQKVQLGSFLKTPYSITGESTAFSMEYLKNNFGYYFKSILLEGAGPLFLAMLIAIGMLFWNRKNRTLAYAGLSLILPLTLMYIAYYFAPQMADAVMRFLLPTFPIYAILVVLAFSGVKQKTIAISITSFIILLNFAWGFTESMPKMQKHKTTNSLLCHISDEVQQNIPEGSIIIANDQLLMNLDYLGKWKLSSENFLITNNTRRRVMNIRPFNRVPGNLDQQKVRPPGRAQNQKLMKYQRKPGEEISKIYLDDMQKWKADSVKVYWLGFENDIDNTVSLEDSLQWIADIDFPENLRIEDMHKMQPQKRQGINNRMRGSERRNVFIRYSDEKYLVIKEWVF